MATLEEIVAASIAAGKGTSQQAIQEMAAQMAAADTGTPPPTVVAKDTTIDAPKPVVSTSSIPITRPPQPTTTPTQVAIDVYESKEPLVGGGLALPGGILPAGTEQKVPVQPSQIGFTGLEQATNAQLWEEIRAADTSRPEFRAAVEEMSKRQTQAAQQIAQGIQPDPGVMSSTAAAIQEGYVLTPQTLPEGATPEQVAEIRDRESAELVAVQQRAEELAAASVPEEFTAPSGVTYHKPANISYTQWADIVTTGNERAIQSVIEGRAIPIAPLPTPAVDIIPTGVQLGARPTTEPRSLWSGILTREDLEAAGITSPITFPEGMEVARRTAPPTTTELKAIAEAFGATPYETPTVPIAALTPELRASLASGILQDTSTSLQSERLGTFGPEGELVSMTPGDINRAIRKGILNISDIEVLFGEDAAQAAQAWVEFEPEAPTEYLRAREEGEKSDFWEQSGARFVEIMTGGEARTEAYDFDDMLEKYRTQMILTDAVNTGNRDVIIQALATGEFGDDAVKARELADSYLQAIETGTTLEYPDFEEFSSSYFKGSGIWDVGKYMVPIYGTYLTAKERGLSWELLGSAAGDVLMLFPVAGLAAKGALPAKTATIARPGLATSRIPTQLRSIGTFGETLAQPVTIPLKIVTRKPVGGFGVREGLGEAVSTTVFPIFHPRQTFTRLKGLATGEYIYDPRLARLGSGQIEEAQAAMIAERFGTTKEAILGGGRAPLVAEEVAAIPRVPLTATVDDITKSLAARRAADLGMSAEDLLESSFGPGIRAEAASIHARMQRQLAMTPGLSREYVYDPSRGLVSADTTLGYQLPRPITTARGAEVIAPGGAQFEDILTIQAGVPKQSFYPGAATTGFEIPTARDITRITLPSYQEWGFGGRGIGPAAPTGPGPVGTIQTLAPTSQVLGTTVGTRITPVTFIGPTGPVPFAPYGMALGEALATTPTIREVGYAEPLQVGEVTEVETYRRPTTVIAVPGVRPVRVPIAPATEIPIVYPEPEYAPIEIPGAEIEEEYYIPTVVPRPAIVPTIPAVQPLDIPVAEEFPTVEYIPREEEEPVPIPGIIPEPVPGPEPGPEPLPGYPPEPVVIPPYEPPFDGGPGEEPPPPPTTALPFFKLPSFITTGADYVKGEPYTRSIFGTFWKTPGLFVAYRDPFTGKVVKSPISKKRKRKYGARERSRNTRLFRI